MRNLCPYFCVAIHRFRFSVAGMASGSDAPLMDRDCVRGYFAQAIRSAVAPMHFRDEYEHERVVATLQRIVDEFFPAVPEKAEAKR